MADNPLLLVIAGCNGSGKSTYSTAIAPQFVVPFDYDKHFLNCYKSKRDSELREKIAHNEAYHILEQSIESALLEKKSFCYETNFNSTPMHWPEIFRKNDYEIHMIYFCMDSIQEAKKRVRIRYENGGHFVPDNEVEERFALGYQHLNKHFKEFDSIQLLDSSGYNIAPKKIASIINGKIESLNGCPEFVNGLLPAIGKLLKQFKNAG